MSQAPVGIDDLSVYGSTLCVDVRAICEARGTSVEAAQRLGLVRKSLAPGFEDPVTLAANAARPLVDAYGKDAFELLLIGTESGVDFAKPLTSYVHHHLGLSERGFHLELKHACFGATAGLNLATAWVRSNPGKRALVIATDLGRNVIGESAEAAGGGAGAVAMVVSAEPKVLAFEPFVGFATREVYDVMRPTPTLERSNGELSMAAYLDLLELAWDGYRATAGPNAFERLDHLIFHTPVASLVQEAHRILADLCGVEGAAVGAHFERCVRPSFGYCQQLGNLYSGCLYAALAGLIDSSPRLNAGDRVGLYSYGSGSVASYFSGVLGRESRATLARHRTAAHLAERRVLDVATYERVVRENERALTEAHFAPDFQLLPGLLEEAYVGRKRLVLTGVADHYRSYQWR